MTQMPGGIAADSTAVESRLREIFASMAGHAETSGFRRALGVEARSLFAYLLEQCNGDQAAIDALYAKWECGFRPPAPEVAQPVVERARRARGGKPRRSTRSIPTRVDALASGSWRRRREHGGGQRRMAGGAEGDRSASGMSASVTVAAATDLPAAHARLANAMSANLLCKGRPGDLVRAVAAFDGAVDRDLGRCADDYIAVHRLLAWRCQVLEQLRRLLRMDDPAAPVFDVAIKMAREALSGGYSLKVVDEDHQLARANGYSPGGSRH